jgi:hypothetical protein
MEMEMLQRNHKVANAQDNVGGGGGMDGMSMDSD